MKRLILVYFLLSTTFLAADSSYAAPLYFPHVATSTPWNTEIALINTSDSQTVTGMLRAFSDAGEALETKDVTLAPRGRRQINIADEFTNHTGIGYIIFDTNAFTVKGYTKFFVEGTYRAAIPATGQINNSEIYIPHIASDTQWWTGVSLLNTTAATKVLTIAFNNGQSRQYTLNPYEHSAFDIASLFNGQTKPDIQSAVITNASGVIGLLLFGSNVGGNLLDGMLLTGNTASRIYYPHVASDNMWWTGIVAYNPSSTAGKITVIPFNVQGKPFPASAHQIAPKGKYIGVVSKLGLYDKTAWLRIDSTVPVSGFELFGTHDGNQLAAYSEVGGAVGMSGIFPKLEKNGWTGIAFINKQGTDADITLTAWDDSGTVIATQALTVGGYAKVAKLAEAIFTQNISSATYITYLSDREVIGFQLNGSWDGTMLDAMPILSADSVVGTWVGTIVGPDGGAEVTFVFNADDSCTAEGSIYFPSAAGTYSVKSGQILVSTCYRGLVLSFQATVSGNFISGIWAFSDGRGGTFELTKQ